MKFCKCGCGMKISNTIEWIKGHNRRGQTHSEYAKGKISQSKLGKSSWNKGISRTEEEKIKIKSSIKEETKKASSERMKKRWADGLCNNFFGSQNPSKRPEVAIKIGEANRKRKVSSATREKMAQFRRGKPGIVVSKKTKKLLSERMKINNPMYQKDVLANHPVLRSGSKFRSDGEKKVASVLDIMKIGYSQQEPISKDKGYYIVDFFLFDYKKIIEFDGHHSHVENFEKDIIRDKYILDRYGYSTLRIVPPEINNTNLPNLIARIGEFLNETGSH